MNPLWIGVGSGVALIILGLVLGVLRLGPEEKTELSVPGLGSAKTSSLATLTLVIGAALLGFSLRQMSVSGTSADTAPASKSSAGSASPIPPPGGQSKKRRSNVLFRDRFQGRDLGSDWQVVSKSWNITNGSLEGKSEGGFSVLTLDRDLPNSYAVSFKTKFLDGALSELMLHLANNNYIRAYLYEVDQDVVLGQGKFLGFSNPVTPGVSSPQEVKEGLGGGESLVEQAFPVQNNLWYRFTAIAQNGVYTIRVGGQDIVNYVDRHHKLSPKGTVGLIVNDGRVQFDDFTIRRVKARS